MYDSSADCARFQSLLAGHLQGDLAPADQTFAALHRAECSRCAETFTAALDADRLLAAWTVPWPPPGLAERVLREIRRQVAPADVRCADLRAEIDGWRSGDLDAARTEALERHAAHCAPCAHQLRIAAGVEGLLTGWRAPAPPAGLKERILDEWVRGGRAVGLPCAVVRPPAPPAKHRARPAARGRWLTLMRSTALAAAAALLLVAYLGFYDNFPSLMSQRGSATRPLEQYHQIQHEVRLEAIAYEQYPAAVGTFDPQPALADRAARRTGNLFHRHLRDALATAAMAKAGR